MCVKDRLVLYLRCANDLRYRVTGEVKVKTTRDLLGDTKATDWDGWAEVKYMFSYMGLFCLVSVIGCSQLWENVFLTYYEVISVMLSRLSLQP